MYITYKSYRDMREFKSVILMILSYMSIYSECYIDMEVSVRTKEKRDH